MTELASQLLKHKAQGTAFPGPTHVVGNRVVVRHCAGFDCRNPITTHKVRQNVHGHREYCVGGDTLVQTTDGIVPIRSATALSIRSADGTRPVLERFDTGVKPVHRVTTDLGLEFYVTEEHRLKNWSNGQFTELRRLEEGSQLLVPLHEGPFPRDYSLNLDLGPRLSREQECQIPLEWTVSLAEMCGRLHSDGFVGSTNNEVGLYFAPHELDLVDRFAFIAKQLFLVEPCMTHRPDGVVKLYFTRAKIKRFFEGVGFHHNCGVPKTILRSPREIQAGYLRGLFDGDGWLDNGRPRFAQSNVRVVKDVQLMLLLFGIVTKSSNRGIPKTWARKEKWDLDLIGSESVCRFNEINFLSVLKRTQYRRDHNYSVGRKRSPDQLTEKRVLSWINRIDDAIDMDTYDLSVPGRHSFTVGGVLVHNCSLVCYSRWSPRMREVISKFPDYEQSPAGLESLILALKKEHGVSGAAHFVGVSRSTVTYWSRKMAFFRQFAGQPPEAILAILGEVADDQGLEEAAKLIGVNPKTLKRALSQIRKAA